MRVVFLNSYNSSIDFKTSVCLFFRQNGGEGFSEEEENLTSQVFKTEKSFPLTVDTARIECLLGNIDTKKPSELLFLSMSAPPTIFLFPPSFEAVANLILFKNS